MTAIMTTITTTTTTTTKATYTWCSTHLQLITLFLSLIIFSTPSWGDAPTHEYKLPNGLKLIVREDHRAPVALFQIWYRVGSSYESNGTTGVAHVLEHMMFKGTEKLKPGEFSELVAKYGGSDNAFTSRDYTGYYQIWEKSRIPLSFELEADRMANLILLQDEFDKELQVVMEERRMRVEDNPNAIAYERFNAAAYASNAYRRPVIGWMHDLEVMTLNDLQQWYNQWYAPNNAIIVIVGDVEPGAMFDLAERFFGDIPPRDLPKAPQAKEIEPLGERRITVKAQAKLPSLIMGFNVPSISTAKDRSEAYALRMLAGVLDGGYSARIEKELIRGSKLAASAGAHYSMYSRGDVIFSVSATPNKEVTVETVEEAIFKLIDELKTSPAQAEELERIQAQVISSIVYEQDSISTQAQNIGTLESMNLSWTLLDETIVELKKITPEQIQAVAKRYLTRDRLTVAKLEPQLAPQPEQQPAPPTKPEPKSE